MSAPSASSFVNINGVSLVYGKKDQTKALDELNMAITEGQFVAVVGPSGCGKSSLMKLVTGLRPPTSGTIDVGGQRIDRPLKIVGMAFQNPTLLPWRRTLSNVMLPMEIVEPHRHSFRADRKQHEARALALLDSVGLDGFATKFPWQLSGGMQQRASLCRALMHQPSLLMLDEPFGALDAFTREELWDVLQDIWLAQKCTTILVTHDLREAVYLADKVFVMSARPGRIIETYDVTFPRPRRPDLVFDPAFAEIVQHLRENIRHQRHVPQAASAGRAAS
jgi:NitT/TauT family transport system ATP-binding protein